ncbi:hypothetical protein ACTJKN_02615 [Pedobacter sp. 22163]|uniref:hypothetical protein n=1 Tax=Pedobacter sp. 22163 TaxID=3453883 RepID=UPI003F87A4B9
MEELSNKAAQLVGMNVIVSMKNGDVFPGILTSIVVNTTTEDLSILLSDADGRGMTFPFKLIADIRPDNTN